MTAMSATVLALWLLVMVAMMCAPLALVAWADYENNRCSRCGKSSGDGFRTEWCPYCRWYKKGPLPR